jgi:hypothetical protein
MYPTSPLQPEVPLDAPLAPRTPSERARRLVFRYAGMQAALLWIGLAFAGFGAIFPVVFCWGLPVDVLLELEGREALGTVVDTRLNRSVTINDEHPTSIRFTYEIDRVVHEGVSSVLEPDLAELPPGAEVALEVSPRNPRWARIAGTTYSTFGWFASFSLLFPLIGVGLLFFAVRSNRREIRAFTWGTPTRGEISSAGLDHSTRINNRHPYKIEWKFRADGRTFSGSISSMEPSDLEPFASSGRICVLYDPDNPKVNTLYVE